MSVLAKILTQSTQQAQHLPHANQPRAKRPHEAYQKPIYEPLRLDPTAFYERFGIAIKHTGWQMALCPFHDDKHASLSVNGTHGGYICHACHVKGNMIGFYMRYHNTDFKGAMFELRTIYGISTA